jgi:hypothetical protein
MEWTMVEAKRSWRRLGLSGGIMRNGILVSDEEMTERKIVKDDWAARPHIEEQGRA